MGDGMVSEAKKGREEPVCVGRAAAYNFVVLIAERFFRPVLHRHLLGVRNQDVLFSSSGAPRGREGRACGRGGGQGMRPCSLFIR